VLAAGRPQNTLFRAVRAPLTHAMLAPLPPECRSVNVCSPLPDADFERLAQVMQPRPDVGLSLMASVADLDDVEFLRFFPWLDNLFLNAFSIGTLSGLRHLHQLRVLDLQPTRQTLSIAPLADLGPSLRRLSVAGPVKHVAALSALTGVRSLTLRAVNMPSLSPLLPMTGLWALRNGAS
jgi:hypothetical protein